MFGVTLFLGEMFFGGAERRCKKRFREFGMLSKVILFLVEELCSRRSTASLNILVRISIF
jgi:hypothetical protein